MNVITSLESMGLTLGLSSDGRLIVDGLALLPREQKANALSLAKEHKPLIVADLRKRLSLDPDDPTPEQLAHMQRLLVDCPNTPGVKWHCWYCSRCPKAAACSAWRHLAVEVKMFRLSGPPYSLYLAEEAKAVLQ